MKDISLSRRAVMLGVAALPMAQTGIAQERPKPVVVSSANAFNGGINCCAKAMELIQAGGDRSEEHTSELQSRQYLVCRLLLEKQNLLVSSPTRTAKRWSRSQWLRRRTG